MRRHTLQRGQTMVEFLIVFPIVLGMVMMILQLCLDYNARNRVQLAASAAARAAIVYIPGELGEPANRMRIGGPKYSAIKTAAVMALMPIVALENGPLSCDVPTPLAISVLSRLMSEPDKRFLAACQRTSLSFQQFGGTSLVSVSSTAGSLSFLGGDEDVAVTVTYQHQELFPVMAVLALTGTESGPFSLMVPIRSRATLPLEGALVRR